jgi:hypothetical protein
MSFPVLGRALARLLPWVCLSGAPLGFSAPTPSTALPPTILDPYLVPGRSSDLVGTAGTSSQGIVGAGDLDLRPLLRRGELLEVIPGVVITQHSGGGKANQYFLRGFNLDHGTDFSVSVDGLPVNLRSHAHGQGYADLNFLVPELVRQVDYGKGPFFADVGDFSSAGAAEFRLRDEFPRPLLSVAGGGNGYARLAAGATRRGPDRTTTGLIELSHEDGPWEVPENFRRANGFLRHRWTAAQAVYGLTAMAYQGDWRSTDQVPQRALDAGTLGRFGSLDPGAGGSSGRASLAFDATWREATATTRLNAYAIHYHLNLYSNFKYFLEDPVHGDQFNQRDRRLVLGGAWQRRLESGGGRRPGETTFGVQWRGDFIDELGLHRTAARRRLGTVRDDTVGEASAGLFARRVSRWNEWVRTDAGLRVDAYRFEVSGNEPRNTGRNGAAILSPKFGAAFGPWAETELYLNAGTGFHSNDARGTTLRVDPADGVTPAAPVTPLVRSRGVEAGVRTAAWPGLVASFSLWTLDLDSELVFVGDAGGTEPTGRTRRYGGELALFWQAASWVALDCDAALTKARYREDAGEGTHLADSISRVITAGIALGRPQGWFGALRLRHFGPQPLVEDDAVRAPSSTTLNARLGWRGGGWELAVEALNALDRANHDIAYHYVSRLPGEPADGVADVHLHPAEPRTWRVHLTRRF